MKKYQSYLIAFATFVIVALAYFYPVLQGKQILQSDIVQFKGSSKEIADYRAKYKKEPYWTNTSFSGMPGYMVSAYYPNDYIGKVDSLLRFLPRPADYLFLYFFSFFILLSVLKVEWKLAILGSLAYGFSTYFIIILGVGHNSKAHAIAYFPLVLSGILLVFNKRYLVGFIVTALAMAFEIHASHIQMTYYLFFLIVILGIYFFIDSVKNKTIPVFFKHISILLVAVLLGIGVNATRLMANNKYKQVSTRGTSELTINPDGTKRAVVSGLDKDYITEYSYGFLETFNLFIPKFMGGGSVENVGKNSNTFQFLKQAVGSEQAKGFVEQLPTYWGKQPIVAAPAYIGAVMVFLFFLGVFLIDNKYKKWLVTATIFALLLSYGKNLGFLTDFFINYVPLYNIFRAVSSIQVIVELSIPLLAILALQAFFNKQIPLEKKWKALKLATYTIGGLALFFTVFGQFLFSFEGQSDMQLDKMIAGLSDAIIADRKAMFFKDSLRSLLLVLITSGVLWAFMSKKINYTKSILLIIGLVLFDLVGIDINYVNESKFVDELKIERPFYASAMDKEILKDKTHFRVANFTGNPMNEARTSYFYNSIGGYSAVKPRRYQELFDFQIASTMNEETLNMLNTKYIIFPDQKGNPIFQKNDDSNGNVWFVNTIKIVNNANEEIKALDHLKTKKEAVVNKKYTNIVQPVYSKDSTATIELSKMEVTKFTYHSKTQQPQFAVFSEMYFDEWQAFIDGVKTPIIPVNYVLRGLVIPKGNHEIIFEFTPTIIAKGNKVTLVSYLLLILIPLGGYFYTKKRK